MKKTLILIGAILLGIIPYAFGESFLINGPPQVDIDTSTPTYVILNSAQSGIIQDINVFIQTNAEFGDDLDIILSHGSTSVFIYNGIGDTSSSYINALFDDEASGSYPVDGTADGTFRPYQPLSGFDGLELSGPWTLSFVDYVIPGDGTALLSWYIEGTVAPIPEPTTMLLLGSGLIGLAGYGRKKFLKKFFKK